MLASSHSFSRFCYCNLIGQKSKESVLSVTEHLAYGCCFSLSTHWHPHYDNGLFLLIFLNWFSLNCANKIMIMFRCHGIQMVKLCITLVWSVILFIVHSWLITRAGKRPDDKTMLRFAHSCCVHCVFTASGTNIARGERSFVCAFFCRCKGICNL